MLAICTLPAGATEGSPLIAFDIPAQPLDTALILFSRQSGLPLFSSCMDQGKVATLQGSLTPTEALQRLLAQTRCRYRFSPASGTVSVQPESAWLPSLLGSKSQEAKPAVADIPTVHSLVSVTVTARKRDERQIDVPISLSAITGEQIDALGISKVADIIAMTPGASSVDNGMGFTQVQIRGVSSSLGGNDNGYYLDEIPFTGVTVPWYPEVRAWDIDRVEVLKGPQGTLFGEGSMGGTVRTLTRKPDLERGGASIETSTAGTRDGGRSWAGKAMLNLPLLKDRLGLRVAVTDESLSGWIDDANSARKDINAQRVKTGRFKLRIAPNERWDVDLAYWRYHSNAPGGGNGALDDRRTNAFYRNSDTWRTASVATRYTFDDSALFYSFADAGLGYANDGMLNPTSRYATDIHINVRTHELRWSSIGERTLHWTLGYYLRDADRQDRSNVGDTPPSRSAQTNAAYAVFGEASLRLADPAWTLTAGLRYFKDDVDAISISTSRTSTLDAGFDSWNPRISLSYKPADDSTLYASVARGFRSGQLQPITSIIQAQLQGIKLPDKLNPDSILTYEIGGKSVLGNGTLMLEGALFHSNWKNVAVRVPINDNFNGLLNSQGTTNFGIEANLLYTPTPAWVLQIGGSWIEASYTEDVPDTPLHKGVSVYNVPHTGITAAAAYNWYIRPRLKGVAQITALHQSRRETALTSGLPGDAITTVTVRLGLESLSGWSGYVFGENLTDDNGAINARNSLGIAQRIRPRTLGVTLRYSY